MTKNNPKISVIVPIYNAEKHLHRCIDSILNQTFTDLEVLLINDGSTDSSGCICNEYAKKDFRVRVFHKENGGVASARNVGLENMQGDFVIHCDSDDFITPNMLDAMYKHILHNNADILICDFYYLNKSNKKQYRVQKPTSFNGQGIISDMLLGRLHGSTWNKLVRTDIIKENNLLFIDKVDYCEDLLFNTQVLCLTNSVCYLPQAFYNYCYNPTSIVQNINKNKVDSIIKYIDLLHEKLSPNFKQELAIHTLQMKKNILNSRVYSYDFVRSYYEEYNSLYKESNLHIYYKILFFFLFKKWDFLVNVLHKVTQLKK